MRLAYFSPLPPSTSGIADYSATLLPELGRRNELSLYSDLPTPLSRTFRVRPISTFEPTNSEAIIYHLGNDAAHGRIYETLLRYPGIVVLHDGTLHHFFVDRTLHRRKPREYFREMAYAHGAGGYDAALLIARGAGIFPFYRFPLIRRPVDLAHGVIVHSQAVRRAVLEARPGARVCVVDHFAFPVLPVRKTRAQLLSELGWPQHTFVVAAFGQASFGKRARVTLEAVARFAAVQPRARFIWVGGLGGEYDLAADVRRLGLAGRAILTGRINAQALVDYIALCDAAINLRFPTSGEASGAVMRLLTYGKPTFVSNAGWFSELPDPVVLKVEVGPQEVEAIAGGLARLGEEPGFAVGIGTAAREFARVRTPARAAAAYTEFAEEIYARGA